MSYRGLAVLALVLPLGLASCSGPDTAVLSADVQVPESSVPSPTSTPDPTTWSLTGLADKQDGKRYPVFVVKVDNTESSHPQVGLADADLVIQEPVEGGVTRLAAFFESNRPKVIGPVRSIRTSDMGMVRPANGILVASGGSPIALNRAQKAGVPVFEEGAAGFFRSADRSAPYNLMLNLRTLSRSDAVSSAKPAKAPYLTYGEFDPPKGKKAARVDLTFSPYASEQWSFDADSNTWQRQGDGGDFDADFLLALSVPLADAGYLDPGGNFVPEVKTTGKGSGWLIRGDRIHPIKWIKKSGSIGWRITTKKGRTLNLPAGRSWISLMSDQTGSVEVNGAGS